MIYTYKYSVLERDGRLTHEAEKIDSTNWLDYLKANTGRYGNLHEFIESSFPALKQENPLIAASIATQIDEIFQDKEPTAVFQYTMYCWDAFTTGEIPAGAWAAAFAHAWQSGQRSMLDSISLSQALVVRMFEAADKEALFRVGANRKDWDEYFAALPETVEIYRGISTATKHMEDGLSWTLSVEEAKKFSGLNVQTERDIPGVLLARIPKEAILALFEPGQEVIINPSVPKQEIRTNFLSGTGLTKFRQNWKKWKADEAKRIKEAQKAF
jgi:hypothetical protein